MFLTLLQEFDHKVSSADLGLGDDDDKDGNVTDDVADPDFDDPLKEKRTKIRGSEFTLKFVNGTWLEDVMPMFDRYGIDNGAVTHILAHILNVGGVDPSKVIFSESTIWRTRSQEWSQNLIRLNLKDSDPHVTIGMDGKKVQMGHNQGGESVEHLVVNAQGVSGPRSLGIHQVADSKGKLVIIQSYA